MKFFCCMTLFPLLLLAVSVNAETKKADPISIPGMTVVKATVRETPPGWAVMQRHLITTMEKAAACLFKAIYTAWRNPL